MINDSNCRNCGAPVEPGKICEYCGTPRPIPVKSAIRMTADSITLECDTLKIGKAVSKQNDAHSIEYGRIGTSGYHHYSGGPAGCVDRQNHVNRTDG